MCKTNWWYDCSYSTWLLSMLNWTSTYLRFKRNISMWQYTIRLMDGIGFDVSFSTVCHGMGCNSCSSCSEPSRPSHKRTTYQALYKMSVILRNFKSNYVSDNFVNLHRLTPSALLSTSRPEALIYWNKIHVYGLMHVLYSDQLSAILGYMQCIFKQERVRVRIRLIWW